MSNARRQVAVGVGWTALQKWLVRLAGLLTFVVLSRLLSPSEIGLAALALAFVGMLSVIADLGGSTFLVQTRQWQESTRSTVFWTALAVATTAGVLVLLLAAPLARLLDQPDLAPVIQALSPLLVLNALGIVPSAMLHRTMRFRALALRETAATAVAAAVGLTLAARGAGVWALVAQSLVQAAVSTLLVWRMSGWRPELRLSRTALTELRRFGGPLLAVNVMQAVRDRLDQFLLGALLGVHALGIWTVAVRLLTVLADVTVAVLDTVALPVFVAARETRERFLRALESAIASAQVLLVPALVALALLSPAVIPWAFGDQWQDAVPPAQVLCLGYGIAGLAYFNRAALLSHGRAGVELLLTSGFLAAHIAMVVIVAPYGLTALAWAGVVEAALSVLVGALTLRSTMGVELRTLARAVRVVGVGSVAGVAALAASAVLAASTNVLTGLAVGSGVALVLLAGGLRLSNRSLLNEVLADVRRVVVRAPA